MSTRTRRRIGVNLLWLVPGEVGGSEEYSVRLLSALTDEQLDEVEVILYVNRRFPEAHPEIVSRFTTVVAPFSGSSRLVRVIAESTWLAARARIDRCELLHHAGGTMPFLRTVPGLLTIHDLQPISNPERFGFIKRAYIRFVAPRSLRNARVVLCLSEFVARDVVDRAGVDPARIRIVPCGVVDPGGSFDEQRRQGLLTKFGLTADSFVLYPAITYAHKNHATLVAAFAQVADSRPELRLVFTGGAGAYDEVVSATIEAYGLDAKVVRTGRIAESDLDLLYRSAAAMAFPSLYEGFGLPILEAMVRGCPVVASDVGALPDVLGGAGELVDPVDVAAWARALGRIADDSQRRSEFAERGLERARHFDWSATAQNLMSVYRETR